MLNVKYMTLKFKLQLKQDCKLPRYKTSALRGGMGKILLKYNCIQDGICSNCEFGESCIITNIMNPKIKVELSFTPKNSTTSPFVIECFDEKEFYKKGDLLEFNIILFGGVISYLSQIIYAFDVLGDLGIGSIKNKYTLLNIFNEDNDAIYEDGRLFKENMKFRDIKDYVNKRKKLIKNIKEINFITPFRLSKKGEITNSLNFKDILYSIYRRLLVLNSYEGRNIEEKIPEIEGDIEVINNHWLEIKRYSNRQNAYMKLGGVVGKIEFSNEINLIKDYMIACELTHIGKNTSFGLGKYEIM